MSNSETRHPCSILAIAVVMYACRTSWSVHLFSSLWWNSMTFFLKKKEQQEEADKEMEK